ncbi:MAG: hypothetical protein CSA62_03170 [Planctomycetota bacterium]|nr:MAG: hypothetical protein CSA62_03170 [Planctomycetota bacterium]
MSEHTQNTDHQHEEGGDHHPHVVPLPLLLGVFAALIFLTIVTVAVTYVDLGWFNVWLAMGIAAIKSILVCLVFMHLLWDRPFNSIIFLASLIFVFLFVSMSLLDTSENMERIKGKNQAFPEYIQQGK